MTALTPDKARVDTGPQDEAVQRGLGRWFPALVTLASALLFYALTTHGSFNPLYEQSQAGFAGRFFFAQADAIVHGHLYVAPAQIPSECWVHQGRCYGYFGLTPSLLRIPFLPLLNSANRAFTSAYMTAAFALAMGSALGIASRTLARVQRTPLITFLGGALTLMLGPASVLVLIGRPAVYEEAIAWSVGFALLGVYCFLRWWSSGVRGWAALLILSLVLSANSRPTTVALAAVMGVGIVIRVLLGRHEPGRGRTVLFGVVVGVLPFATCVGVYWLKFHTLVPNSLLNQQIGGPAAAPWWLAIRRVDHNSLQGLRFLPTELIAFLRPDGLAFSSVFPFVNFSTGLFTGTHYVGIPAGSLYIEPFSTIPDAMPLAAAAVIGGCVYGLWGARRRAIGLRASLVELLRSPMTYCVVGAAGSCAVMLTQGVLTDRYLADFFPLFAVSLPVAARCLAPVLVRLSGRTAVAVAAAVVLLVAWSLLVNLGLEYQAWWHTTV